MAAYRVRDPGSFPPDFHRVMNQGEGVDKLVTRRFTRAAVITDRFNWSVFLYSLRCFSTHPSAWWVDRLKHRTRIAYNHDLERWELLVTSRRPVLEDMEILE